MKKKLNIEILYFLEGVQSKKNVEVFFVSNYCIKEYNKNILTQIEINKKIEQLSKLKTEILLLNDVSDIEDNLDQQEKIEEYLSDVECSPFYIVERILEDNEIKDRDLYDKDFWYKKTNKGCMYNFLTQCIFKDLENIDKEKKVNYTLHEDRLLIALNKYWRPIDQEYYLNKMDIPDTNEAIIQSQMPEYVQKRIWEKEKKIELFDFFKNYNVGGK